MRIEKHSMYLNPYIMPKMQKYAFITKKSPNIQ